MTGAVLRALLSHWRRNPLQLISLIAGLALATALWSGVQAINAEARASYTDAANRVSQGQYDRLVAAGPRPLRIEDFAALRRAGWQVSPRITGHHTPSGLTVLGVEPLTAPRASTGAEFATLAVADFLLGRIAFALPDTAGTSALEIDVAPLDGLPEGTVLMDISAAARMLDRGDTLDALVILPEQSRDLPDITSVTPHLTRVDAQTDGADIARLTDSFHLNLTAFGFLSFAVGLFIVYGAIGLAFEQRRTMFRTLRALGLPLSRLIALLVAELILLALIAGLLGIALGYAMAAALLPGVAATLSGLYGADVPGTLSLRAQWWIPGLAIAVLGTLAAGSGTLIRMRHMPLLDAGSPQAWAQRARRTTGFMALLGAALMGIAVVLTTQNGDLVTGFAMLGALLIGAALILPWILDQCLAMLTRLSPPPLPAWFWADTRQQIPGLSMALMALLLAMSANIGVSTMVSSFRLTFTGWLDQRLASELYVTTANADQSRAMYDLLRGRVDAILPIMSAPLTLNGQPGDVFAVMDHSTYSDNWPLLSATPNVWEALQIPGHALINEQLALRADLSVGDLVPSASAETIVGIYSDYGNPAPQVIIGLPAFEARFPGQSPTRFGIRTQDPDEILTLLHQDLGLPRDALANQTRIKALSLSIFEQTFTVTSALNVLTLAVAGFSILMSLLTLSQMRLPQLAPVWALGITRRQLGLLELWRALALAALVMVLALPLGLALAWVLLAVVNVAAFGWRLPMYLFPLSYVAMGGLGLLAAALAALVPAWRLMRTAPHHLLQVFSASR